MEKQIAQKLVRALAIVLWVAAAMLIIAAVSLTTLSTEMLLTMMEDPEFAQDIAELPNGVADMQTMMHMVTYLFIVPLALLSIIAGIGVWMGRNWGRICALVACVIFLFSFPVGTAIGIFGIWLLGFENATRELFTRSAAAKKGRSAKRR